MNAKSANTTTESHHKHIMKVFDVLSDHPDNTGDIHYHLIVGNSITKTTSIAKTDDSYNSNILPSNDVYLDLYYGAKYADPQYNDALLGLYKLLEKRLLANGVKL